MISGVIITLNEASNIAACIHSIKTVCDEVIVVDANSQDHTAELARSKGAKVIIKEWHGYGAARNAGANAAANDWILSIDADERLSPELTTSIKGANLESQNAYKFNRLSRYCHQWIKHGIWYPEWKTRLYHRAFNHWDSRLVHEQLQHKASISESKLQGNLLHYAYDSPEDLRSRLDRYAQLSATQWKEDGTPPFLIKKVLSPTYHFLRSYILKMGFLDGHAGLQIARAIKEYNQKKYEYYRNME